MKYILIIGDGMADNPVEQLGWKTPLEKAEKPAIDYIAEKGMLGSVFNVPEGMPAGSDTAILSIMGCDPHACFTGRAPLEAASVGIKLNPGDAAYRCNMVTYEDTDKPLLERKILSHSAGSISGADSDGLIDALFADAEFKTLADKAGLSITKTASFRHMTVQRAADITGIVLIPPHDHLGEVIGPLMPSGCANAQTLMELMITAHRVLDRHPINERRRAEGKLPANGIWFWAEGTAVKLPQFKEHYGKTGAVISAVPLCHGIAALTGLVPISVEGATGELDSNLEGKVDAAEEALKKYDFITVHVEAPDECTHNGDLEGKIKSIEYLDRRVVGPVMERARAMGEDFRLMVISDHKTLTSTRGHDGEAVPFAIYDSREKNAGSGLPYTEANGLKGPMISRGVMLLAMLFGD